MLALLKTYLRYLILVIGLMPPEASLQDVPEISGGNDHVVVSFSLGPSPTFLPGYSVLLHMSV